MGHNYIRLKLNTDVDEKTKVKLLSQDGSIGSHVDLFTKVSRLRWQIDYFFMKVIKSMLGWLADGMVVYIKARLA